MVRVKHKKAGRFAGFFVFIYMSCPEIAIQKKVSKWKNE